MYASTLLVSLLGASTVIAAPTWPTTNWDAASPEGLKTVSEYFNMLAEKVQVGRFMSAAPVCDLSMAQMDTGMSYVYAGKII